VSVTPDDLLDWAHATASHADETARRASTSRAYYAAYHASDRWHAKLPAPGSLTKADGGAHEKLIDRLRNPAPECSAQDKGTSLRLAYMLAALRGNRVLADYHLEQPFDAALAATSCQTARLLLEATR
jgi:hypothetical protein